MPRSGCWAALAFLLVVAIGYWLLAGRPWALAATAAALAVAALLLPAAYIPVAPARCWERAIACWPRGCVRRRRRDAAQWQWTRSRRQPLPLPPPGLPRPSSWPWRWCSGGASARGDPPEQGAAESTAADGGTPAKTAAEIKTVEKKAAEKRTPSSPYRVFVPVDEHDRPSGGKYYVPEPFYDQLYRRTASQAEKPQGWLMAAGVYRATLAKEEMSQRLAVEELRVRFDLHVFSNSVRVRIPFRRDEVQLLPGASQLDGRAIQPQWAADGGALVVEIPEPGQFRLELALRPGGAKARRPRVSTWRFRGWPPRGWSWRCPRAHRPSRCPSACGASGQEEQGTRMVADLGPAGRLTVRWQDPAGAGPGPPAIDAEELFWLKIQPGSVVIDAKLKLTVASGQMRRLQLVADPSLQTVAAAGPDAPAVRASARPPDNRKSSNCNGPARCRRPRKSTPSFCSPGHRAWAICGCRNWTLPTSGRRSAGWPSPSIRRWNTRSGCRGGGTRWPCPSSPPVGARRAAPLLACRLAPGLSRWSIATGPGGRKSPSTRPWPWTSTATRRPWK